MMLGQKNCRSVILHAVFLHVRGIQHIDFTPLSKVQGSATEKLAQLHSIRDRRLREPQDSSYRMEDTCNRIPEGLAGLDLEAVGYNRGYYQSFTKNRDHLKCSVASKETSPSHSPCKPQSYSMHLFPQECIFCGKLEVKVSGKTEQCRKFPVFKDRDGTLKEPTW